MDIIKALQGVESAYGLIGLTLVILAAVWIAKIRNEPENNKTSAGRITELEKNLRERDEQYFTALGELMQVKSEEAVRQQKSVMDMVAHFFDSFPSPVWVKDHNHVVRYINREYINRFSVNPELYLGMTDRDRYEYKYYSRLDANDSYVVANRMGGTFLEIVPNVFMQKGIENVKDTYHKVGKSPLKLNGDYGSLGILFETITDEDEIEALMKITKNGTEQLRFDR